MAIDARTAARMREIRFEVALEADNPDAAKAREIQSKINGKKLEQAGIGNAVERLEEQRAHRAEARQMVGEAIQAQEARLKEVAFLFATDEASLDDAKAIKSELEDLRLRLELYDLASPRFETKINEARGHMRGLGTGILNLEEERDALVEKSREILAQAMV